MRQQLTSSPQQRSGVSPSHRPTSSEDLAFLHVHDGQLAPDLINGLQRAVGNQETQRILQQTMNEGRPGQDRNRFAAKARSDDSPAIVREPTVFTSLPAGFVVAREASKPTQQSGPIPPRPDPYEIKIEPMSAPDRQRIKDETSAEIVLAFTAFTDACQANITAMKASAKADAELAALFIDIATGFLAPGLANLVIRRAASKAVAVVTDAASKKAVAALISQSDMIKASFTAVTKTGSTALKVNSTRLFGEAAEDALLDGLKIEFQKNATSLAGKLGSMTDGELLSTWVVYDPEVANVTTYKSTIKNLLDEFHNVQSIGDFEMKGGGGTWASKGTNVYRIEAFGKKDRMIVITESRGGYGHHQKTFKAWVPEYFEAMAIEESKDRQGGVIGKIELNEIDGGVPKPADAR